jgi:hypothetical protein
MKKIIFLDHDGVICLASEWGSRFKNKEGLDSEFDRFNDKAIKVLNEIIEETDCEIVVSSDWKYHTTLDQMQELYKMRNVKKSPIDYTPSSVPIQEGYPYDKTFDLEQQRSLEILEWLKQHPEVTHWVAVDDLHMGLHVKHSSYGEFYRDWGLTNFVWTPSSQEGIKQNGVKDKIINFFK